MSLKKQALSGIFWSALQLLGTQGIAFGVSLILARLLVPAEFGLIAMLSIFISLGNALINSGLPNSLIRSDNLDDEDYSTVFYFNLAGSIVIYLIIYLCAPLIANFYNQELLTLIIRVYCSTFVINAFSAIQIARLTKLMDFKTQLKVSVPSLIIGSIVGITMAYNGFGVWSLVWSGIVQSLAATVQLWYWAKWQPLWVFNVEKFKRHFNYGVKLMFSGIIDIVFTNAYTIIIAKFYSPAQVGFYNRADQLQMLPASTVSSIVTRVSFPLFSSIQNDDVRLKDVYKRIMAMVIFLVAPIIIFMAVMAEPLFRFLFTDLWLPAVPYFQILCFSGILYPLHSYNLQILTVKGRSDLFLKLEIAKKVMFTIVILISFNYGIYGLLYGANFASLLAFFINAHYSGKFLNYSSWEQTKDLLPIIVLSSVAGIVVYFFDLELSLSFFNDFSRLAFSGMLGAIIYLIGSYICKMSSLIELINIVKRK